ncbi:DNA-binding transcriptional regulator GbsR, MarR family [Salinibacillus kushneri]|uniref:HTH-type transcriptional regulator n=1 Tax=Salinibacillus kushneri TaxID=237682 RepID=A0A1I0AZP6_9BACI|nr:helix-turn-helix domain-containing protein [Salinibacillus kushneri]SES99121.1 DNA-binding transcriptional regulator GbsR, MarR family [Salinibacillus kushneri]
MQKANEAIKLDQVHNQVISEFSKTLEMFDLSPSEARLFVTLYINQKPMTLDQMSQALGKSKTSMSTGIRSLLDANLVERVWIKGVRKDLYQANERLYRMFMSAFIYRWLDAANRQEQSLKEIDKMLADHENISDNDYLKTLRKRINDMIEFLHLIEETFQDMEPNTQNS